MNDKPFIVHSGVINKLSKVTLSPEPEFSLWWIVSESKKNSNWSRSGITAKKVLCFSNVETEMLGHFAARLAALI